MSQQTYKTSTVFIGTGKTTKVFRSVSDVPKALRRKLMESTSGENAGIILIADRGGREEILKALRRRSRTQRVPGFVARSHSAREYQRLLVRLRPFVQIWPELLVVGLIAIVAWVVFAFRY